MRGIQASAASVADWATARRLFSAAVRAERWLLRCPLAAAATPIAEAIAEAAKAVVEIPEEYQVEVEAEGGESWKFTTPASI
mmetsp:Transcript_58241/g.123635  ORF Transcript_58241/g.123635 Transcript_58241/m.123635 type:complete len:82 (-) Transcript_58241:378-623(-)